MSQTLLSVELGTPRMDMTSRADTWDATWADDGNLYASSDDSWGFNNQPSRNLHYHVIKGDAPSALVGTTINTMDEYGGGTQKGPDGCMWKANGNMCVEGALYLFVSRHGLDFSARQTAEHSSLIRSTDKGRTWQRTAAENYSNPMFPGGRFGSPFFVQYGQNGQADVHNADRYVFAVANNGFWENGDDMIVARVPKADIGGLQASDWQFHVGGDGMRDASWSRNRSDARPVIVNPGRCSMTGAQYIAPLKRYMMIQWYYTRGSGHVASTDTTWLFYESPTPWGPWRAFDTKRFSPHAYYNPCIPSKLISQDGKEAEITPPYFVRKPQSTTLLAGNQVLRKRTTLGDLASSQ